MSNILAINYFSGSGVRALFWNRSKLILTNDFRAEAQLNNWEFNKYVMLNRKSEDFVSSLGAPSTLGSWWSRAVWGAATSSVGAASKSRFGLSGNAPETLIPIFGLELMCPLSPNCEHKFHSLNQYRPPKANSLPIPYIPSRIQS